MKDTGTVTLDYTSISVRANNIFTKLKRHLQRFVTLSKQKLPLHLPNEWSTPRASNPKYDTLLVFLHLEHFFNTMS